MKHSQKRTFMDIEKMNSDEFKAFCRSGNKNYFTRIRKMPLQDLLFTMINRKGLTLALELRNYMKLAHPGVSISKPGYLKQRMKLNPDAFLELYKYHNRNFYADSSFSTYKDYLILAADGSDINIPTTAETLKLYGSASRKNTKPQAQIGLGCIYDVMNRMILESDCNKVKFDEMRLAEKQMERIPETIGNIPYIIIMDRGYPSTPAFIHMIDEAYLKLYDGHDWKWFCVRLNHTDKEYLRKNWSGKKASAPTLEKRHHKYFLRFSYTEDVILTKTPVKEQIICSVDLGINTDAVCTIMRADGTVLGRRFIDHPSEKDRMYRTLGRIRRFQREHGSAQSRGRWAYTKRLNTELGKRIAGAIVKYAEENHADVIVFEYLETQGKISGKKKQKLHLWRKRDIQKRCEHQAHRKGMRVSRVCAWNTSRLAYDGSGSVSRDPKNHSLCVFQTGKRYNCDLSASYNIGARYFIRELLKPLLATERSLLEAKVPVVKRRTSCVYADLRELHLQMEILKAA